MYESLDLERNETNMKKITLLLIGSSFVVALLFQKVSMYFGLIGGTVGVMMAGGFPLACFYKLVPLSSTDMAIMVYVVIMCVLCFIGAMQSVFNPAWYDVYNLIYTKIIISSQFYLLDLGFTLKHALIYV